MPHTPRIHENSGQTMAEYSVVVGVLILGVVGAIGFFGAAVAQYLQAFVQAIT